MGRPLNRSVAIAAAAAVCIRLLFGTVPARGEGFLERLRQTVRIPPLASPSQAPNEKPEKVVVEHHHYHHYYGRDDDDDEGLSDLYALGFIAAGLAASSPWWGPHMLLGDDFDSGGFFPRFPYDDVPGYMMIGPKDEAGEPGSGNGKSAGGIGLQQPWPVPPRRVAVRFATEYAGDMGDVERLAGRLLLSTSSRWEFDTGFHYFEEVLAAGGRDQLWLGDFNVVLRFAQHEHRSIPQWARPQLA